MGGRGGREFSLPRGQGGLGGGGQRRCHKGGVEHLNMILKDGSEIAREKGKEGYAGVGTNTHRSRGMCCLESDWLIHGHPGGQGWTGKVTVRRRMGAIVSP